MKKTKIEDLAMVLEKSNVTKEVKIMVLVYCIVKGLVYDPNGLLDHLIDSDPK
ncbi:MAG: hypothetical protein LBN12_02855 [Clostridiales Family XIII bacterium]|jgi:hypothetical protein|nr:hypothetical protein [Clostridiales Family XIII bacterium]